MSATLIGTEKRSRITPGGLPLRRVLREAVDARHLLGALVWRIVRIRYAQTALGIAWALLQPALSMVIMSIIFGRFAGIPSQGVPYPLFAYTGVMLWVFFSSSLAAAGESLVSQAGLITKVYFPRILLPAAAIVACLIDLALSYSLLALLLVFYRIGWRWEFMAVPPVVALSTLLAFGFGLFLAGLNARYRDVRYALPFLTQLWMFATPIIYPLALVPDRWRWLLLLNPMTGLVEAHRAALLGTALPWDALLGALIIAPAITISGLYYFRNVERSLADVV